LAYLELVLVDLVLVAGVVGSLAGAGRGLLLSTALALGRRRLATFRHGCGLFVVVVVIRE
jgi:hypothetical protein